MTATKKLIKNYLYYFLLYGLMIIIPLISTELNILYLGLKNILTTPDILLTDYFAIGGIGATFINVGLTGLSMIALLIRIGVKPNGSTIMSLWLTTGFSFFGKNIINIWPIIIGVWLFSKYKKEPFLNYILIALLGTTLSPTVTQLSFTSQFSFVEGYVLGFLLGICIGFILPPISSYCLRLHQGFNLYNLGFSGGLLAMFIMSIYRSLGIDFESNLILFHDSHKFLSIIVIIICISLLLISLTGNNKYNIVNSLRLINKSSGRLVSDYYLMYGNRVYANMGIMGLISLIIVFILGGELNGPLMGAIFTIIGFSAFGKHPKNTLPVILGATLSASINILDVNSPQMLISILFSTCLAPIAGNFGFIYGVIAGFLHVFLVTNIGYVHGGLNLYNNGLSGGFVCVIMLPLIHAFKKENINEKHY